MLHVCRQLISTGIKKGRVSAEDSIDFLGIVFLIHMLSGSLLDVMVLIALMLLAGIPVIFCVRPTWWLQFHEYAGWFCHHFIWIISLLFYCRYLWCSRIPWLHLFCIWELMTAVIFWLRSANCEFEFTHLSRRYNICRHHVKSSLTSWYIYFVNFLVIQDSWHHMCLHAAYKTSSKRTFQL